MEYIDWVHAVMTALVKAWRSVDHSEKLMGLEVQRISEFLDLDVDAKAPNFDRSKVAEALRDALRDLELVGWAEADNGRFYKVTRFGEAFPQGDVTTAWKTIVDISLDDEEIAFLEVLATAGEERYETHACVRDLDWRTIFGQLGWSTEDSPRAYYLTERVEDLGMLRRDARMGGAINVVPTYVGIVRATKIERTEYGMLITDLVDEWETTNVEFKRELNLDDNMSLPRFPGLFVSWTIMPHSPLPCTGARSRQG